MGRTGLLLLVGTAFCWGTSFAFIKIALAEVTPETVMAARCLIGAALLWPAIFVMGRLARSRDREPPLAPHEPALRSVLGPLMINGLLTALPFFLIAWGLQVIDSGIAGIVNASVPLWAAVLALRWDQEHPTTRQRAVGVLVGFAGIVLLFAARGAIGGSAELAALSAAALAAALYAVSGIYVRERLAHVAPARVAAWSVTLAALLLSVPAAWDIPAAMPSRGVLASIVILGVLGTGIGMLLYYELIGRVGAARASLVTYLLPPLSVLWGVLLLDERVRPEGLAAMALILGGVWLASLGGSRKALVERRACAGSAGR